MANRFEEAFEIDFDDPNITKQEHRDWAENMRPTEELVDLATMRIQSFKIGVNLFVPRWQVISKTFADFAAAATVSNDVDILSLGKGGIVLGAKINVTEVFEKAAAAAFTVANMDFGWTPSAPLDFIDDADMKVLTGQTAAGKFIGDAINAFQLENGTRNLIAQLDCGAENTNLAVTGKVDFIVWYAVAPSPLL